MLRLTAAGIVAATLLSSGLTVAADAPQVTIQNHTFTTNHLELPAGKRIQLTIFNADKTAEEFDSSDLHIEKLVAGGQTAAVFVGPLAPGTYDFVGELHKTTAHGQIIVK